MTAVIRLALPRFRASIMISCSISQLLTGSGADCRTKASHPRTDSWNRTKISPLANSRAVCAVTWTSSSLATCSASSGCARPEKSIKFLRLSVQSWLNALPSPNRGGGWKAPSYEANGTELWPGCQLANSQCRFGFWRLAGFRDRWGALTGGFLGGLGCLRGRTARALAAHPPFDVALRTRGYGQRSGRDVVAHHRARPGVGAVADGHRRHEHGVRAGAHVRADGGPPLGFAVVVDKHAGRADVAVFADVRVPDVGQVRHFGAGADGGVLGLDERAELAVVAQHRAGAQVGERSDGRAGTDRRRGAVRAHHRGAVADADVRQGGVRADDAVAADLSAAKQLRPRLNDGVAPDGDVDVDPDGARIDDGDARHLMVRDD